MLFYLLSMLGLVPTFQKSKCKRLLNTTMERIKLLKKRRETRFRQLHRDVMELLQRGKEQNVQPCLERIWRELCLLSVYDKIAEYCHVAKANLNHIAQQGECPSVLKEALSGLCFATSCCADLPELQELREIFALKYGKLIVNSAQELQPNCHVNQQFWECLCAKDPSDTRKQKLLECLCAEDPSEMPKQGLLECLCTEDPSEMPNQELLEEIITQYNVKKQSGHEHDTQQQEIHKDFVEENEYNQLQEGIDHTMMASEVEHQSEWEELPEVDAVQEPNNIESTVCKEDMESKEFANRKRSLEDTETRRAACKRAYRRFWPKKSTEEEENNGKELEKAASKQHGGRWDEVRGDTGQKVAIVHHNGHEGCCQGEQFTAQMNRNEEQSMLPYAKQPSLLQPPHRRPPPPPPPKRAPPLPMSLRVVSMPRLYTDAQGIAGTHLPLSCSTMANNYYLETYGSHVHPRLPRYEDLVADFTARKH